MVDIVAVNSSKILVPIYLKWCNPSFQVIESLGIIIYKALDYGLKENEERELSPPLEQLIDHMTNTVEADGSKDEGYEALDEGVEEENDKGDVEVIQSYRDVMKVQTGYLILLFILFSTF